MQNLTVSFFPNPTVPDDFGKPHSGRAQVDFTTPELKEQFLAELERGKLILQGRALRVWIPKNGAFNSASEATNTLFIGGLWEEVTLADMNQAFQEFEGVKDVKISERI
jgi:hypothetical protein